ncbi:MAG: hypothetical protein IJ728_11880 [Selenomonadaceae bacterium]|nr:hypothetical protein [Selenomonadaceae bacterium]
MGIIEKASTEQNDLLTLTNKSKATVTVDDQYSVVSAKNRTKAIYIAGNSSGNSIKGGSGNDTLVGGEGDDTLIGGKGKNLFIYNGGDDVITDYVAGTDKIKINDSIIDSKIDENDIILNFDGGGSLTVKNVVKNGKPKKITIINQENITTSLTYGVEKLIVANGDGDTIDLNTMPSVEKVDASKRKKGVYIIGNENELSIKGGSGNDTLKGSEYGNDTLTGGKGADLFIYNGGDDIITDYSPKQNDKIRLIGTRFSSGYASFDGNDLILDSSSGTLTIKNGKDKKITFVDANGNELGYTKVYKNSTEKYFLKSDKDTVYSADSYVVQINASKLTKGIKITGNNQDNIIKGGSGSDTINGRFGDDTLTGGKGKDHFVYEKGNDVITDYKSGEDVIEFKNLSFADVNDIYLTGEEEDTDLVFKFKNGGTLTVMNAVKISKKSATPQKITIIENAGTSSEKISTRYYNLENLNLTNADEDTINGSAIYYSKLVKINASKRKKSIYIKGNDNENIITGGSKNDILIAGSKSTTLNGGFGNDSIVGSTLNDLINGGEGSDTINAGAGDDIINGGKGNDLIYGDEGADSITASLGNDTIYGGKGNDFFYYTVGDGDDTIADYNSSKNENDIIQLGKKTTITNVEISKKDCILTIGKSNLTLKNAAKKTITVVDYSGETTTYYNGKKSTYTERDYWFVDNAEFRMQNDELETILDDENNLIVDDLNFNDQINSQEKVTSLTYSQQKK